MAEVLEVYVAGTGKNALRRKVGGFVKALAFPRITSEAQMHFFFICPNFFSVWLVKVIRLIREIFLAQKRRKLAWSVLKHGNILLNAHLSKRVWGREVYPMSHYQRITSDGHKKKRERPKRLPREKSSLGDTKLLLAGSNPSLALEVWRSYLGQSMTCKSR